MTKIEWITLLEQSGLKQPGDSNFFELFNNARLSPSDLAGATESDLDSTLDGYQVPIGEVRVLIKKGLRGLQGSGTRIH
jgi:hypothetical protein